MSVTLVAGVHVMMRPQHVSQDSEAVLLGIVEALIQRRAGVGDLLERGAGLGHGVGVPCEPVERRCGGCVLFARLLIGRLPGLHALHAQLRHVAQRLLESRPVFRLIGRELETGLERGDPCVGERRHILGARPDVGARSAERRSP